MTHNPAPVPTTGLGSSSGNFSIGLTGAEKSGKSDDIENPPEMEAMEAGEDNILNECDPETLKEMERRTDEIVEQFMELALDMKSQKRDEAILVYAQEQGKNLSVDDDDDEFPDELQELLAVLKKEMNTKRKAGLKNLKLRLAAIIEADDMQVQQKLQKLYDESELDDYMKSLLD